MGAPRSAALAAQQTTSLQKPWIIGLLVLAGILFILGAQLAGLKKAVESTAKERDDRMLNTRLESLERRLGTPPAGQIDAQTGADSAVENELHLMLAQIATGSVALENRLAALEPRVQEDASRIEILAEAMNEVMDDIEQLRLDLQSVGNALQTTPNAGSIAPQTAEPNVNTP